jgi:hypothetical protein
MSQEPKRVVVNTFLPDTPEHSVLIAARFSALVVQRHMLVPRRRNFRGLPATKK